MVLVKDEEFTCSEDGKTISDNDEENDAEKADADRDAHINLETEGDMVNVDEQPYADLDQSKLHAI